MGSSEPGLALHTRTHTRTPLPLSHLKPRDLHEARARHVLWVSPVSAQVARRSAGPHALGWAAFLDGRHTG